MSIDEAVAKLPAQMMSRSGSLFDSSRAAFQGTSDLYILGLNFGGSPVRQADETITRDVSDGPVEPDALAQRVTPGAAPSTLA
jgi:hypothetical protein